MTVRELYRLGILLKANPVVRHRQTHSKEQQDIFHEELLDYQDSYITAPNVSDDG